MTRASFSDLESGDKRGICAMTPTCRIESAREQTPQGQDAGTTANRPSSTPSGHRLAPGLSRRRFLGHAGGLAGATLGAGLGGPALLARPASATAVEAGETAAAQTRADQAYRLRVRLAEDGRAAPLPEHPVSDDEARYPTKIGSYAKGLPLDDRGEVDGAAYDDLLAAIASGNSAAFEAIPLGGSVKLANPQSAFSFELMGPDSHHLGLAAPPAFASAEQAGELVELYWAALTRDVAFAAYETDPIIAQAAAELSGLSTFRGPTTGGTVTPATLFRGTTPADLVGPYLSQFLFRDIPYGPTTVPQRYRVPVAGDDHMTAEAEWLHIQRGGEPACRNELDTTPHYLRNGRDLGEYVHQDFSYQAYLNAALILLGLDAPLDASNPYHAMRSQAAFATFGPPALLDAVARVAACALKAAWYQKWVVHRRVRPEAYGGRVHQTVTGAAADPIHAELLQSQALAGVVARHGTALLPQAYPEGSPTHPAYPAGHAVVAGACTTVLKAFFDGTFVLPDSVEASADGLSLAPYDGELTVANELNKLGANIAIGRNTAGVHWRSDGAEGLLLGEAVALGVLAELRACMTEDFAGFSLTTFNGTPISV
jgi:hypothetical protein